MPVGTLFWFAGLAEVLGGAAITLGYSVASRHRWPPSKCR